MAAANGMDGWIALVGDKVQTIAGEYTNDVVGTLATAISPLVLVALTIWWMLLGWAIMRGEVQNGITTVIWKAFKTSIVVLLALNAGAYNSNIAVAYSAMRDSMVTIFATAVAGPDGSISLMPTTVWTSLDALQSQGLSIVHQMDLEASWYNVGILVAEAIFTLGLTALVVAALYIAILSTVFGAFFIAVGPLFIACLLFQPTQRFFDGWLSMLLNTIVLTWIGMFVAGFGVHIVQSFAVAINNNFTSINALGTAAQFLAACFIFAAIILQAPSWASALTGGTSMKMGGGVASTVVRGASLFRGVRAGAGATAAQSNAITNPSLLSRLGSRLYQGGINSAARPIGRGLSGAQSIARRAQYQLASLRGRT